MRIAKRTKVLGLIVSILLPLHQTIAQTVGKEETLNAEVVQGMAPLAGSVSLSALGDGGYMPYVAKLGKGHGTALSRDTSLRNDGWPISEVSTNSGGARAETPVVYKTINGQSDSRYTPPDNDVAISGNGIIVSVINSIIRVHNASTGAIMASTSFTNMIRAVAPTLTSVPYDPRVVYDRRTDRFMGCVLHGTESSNSKLIVFFSKTNNPAEGWNIYTLEGNPFGTQNWLDYPAIALHGDQLVITGNLFTDADDFDRVAVYVVQASDGLEGAMQLRHKVLAGFKSSLTVNAFSLVPVAAANGYGNNGGPFYFVSHNLGTGLQAYLFSLTTLATTTGQVSISRRDINYIDVYLTPTNAEQTSSSVETLNSGDTRIKQAIQIGDVVHYVFTTYSTNFDRNVIGYVRYNFNSNTANLRLIGNMQTHYAYPSVAMLGNETGNDQRVLIGMLASSESINPSMYCIVADGEGSNFDLSTVRTVRLGSGGVNIDSQEPRERWGDYSGISRRPNSNKVYFSGSVGNAGAWATFIGEIGLSTVGIEEQVGEIVEEQGEVQVFPNPAVNFYKVAFTSPETGMLEMSLVDASGKLVEVLVQDKYRGGRKEFSFNAGALKRGIYVLRATLNGKPLWQKIVLQ